jgi:hypothetical protein
MRPPAVLVSLLLVLSPALAQKPPELPPTKPAGPKTNAYADFPEPWRSRFTQDWEDEVERLKGLTETGDKRVAESEREVRTLTKQAEKLGNVTGANVYYERALLALDRARQELRKRQQTIRDNKERLDRLLRNSPLYVRPLPKPKYWKEGVYGVCDWEWELPIRQIIDDERLLTTDKESKTDFILKLPTTRGLTDDRVLVMQGWFFNVSGTTRYRTVAGSTRTVFVAEAQLLSSLKPTKSHSREPLAEAPDKAVKPDPGAAESSAAPTMARGAAAYDVFPEPWRGRFVRHWEQEVEDTRNSIRGGQAVAKNRARLADLERNDPPYFGNHGAQYPLDEWKVGDYGWCRRRPLILQVIPPGQVVLGEKAGIPLVLLKVSSTAGLAAGRPFVLDDVVTLVTGMTTYKTATGGTKTVLTAELVKPDSLKKKE